MLVCGDPANGSNRPGKRIARPQAVRNPHPFPHCSEAGHTGFRRCSVGRGSAVRRALGASPGRNTCNRVANGARFSRAAKRGAAAAMRGAVRAVRHACTGIGSVVGSPASFPPTFTDPQNLVQDSHFPLAHASVNLPSLNGREFIDGARRLRSWEGDRRQT